MNVANIISLSTSELTSYFAAILLLLTSAHLFGYLFEKMKMPRVIGEITGGIILGPSGLGHFCPDLYNQIFNGFEGQGKLIAGLYWLGLVLLMFVSGFSFEKTLNKENRKLVIAILIGATIIPFAAGWILPDVYDFSKFLGGAQNMSAFRIVMGIMIGVTSIPVISKIFIDLNIMHKRFAKIIITVATVQDVILWVLLSIATGMMSVGGISVYKIVFTVVVTFVFLGFSLTLIPSLISRISRSCYNLMQKSTIEGYAFIICMFFVIVTCVLDINILFGALVAGTALGGLKEPHIEASKSKIKDISMSIFVPIYFSVVGLKIDLIHSLNLKLLLFILLFVSVMEVSSTMISALLLKLDWLSSFNLGISMNARGGPGIVMASVAYDIGIINESLFVVFIMVSIITSLMTGYWLRFVLSKGWHLLKLPSRGPKTSYIEEKEDVVKYAQK